MKRRLKCLLVDLGWRLGPVTAFRSWLLRSHLDDCPACLAGLASREESLRLFPTADGQASWSCLARAVASGGRLDDESPFTSGRRRKGWPLRIYAGVTTAAVLVLLAGFGWYLGRQGNGSPPHGVDTYKTKIVSTVSLDYVLAKGRRADIFIFQTDDPEMVIIWVESSN